MAASIERGIGRQWLRLLGRVSDVVVGRSWRRVFTLASLPLLLGVGVVLLTRGDIWDEIGIALIGGSLVAFAFAIVQYTLDLLSAERQAVIEVRQSVTSGRELDGMDLARADLSGAYLWAKQLDHARLDDAGLTGANLGRSTLAAASLLRADLHGANLTEACLADAVLDDAVLAEARLPRASLARARLVGADLTRADLSDLGRDPSPERPESRHVDLSGAVAREARLARSRLPDLRAAFLDAAWLDAPECDLTDADLSCADLRGANLRDADLRNADLSGADLAGANLERARLDGAHLVGARLEQADLTAATVAGADLRACDLRGAYLTHVDLGVARLDGAWARREDLERAAPLPEPAGRALCLVDDPDAAAYGAAAGVAARPEAAADDDGRGPGRPRLPGRLVLVPGGDDGLVDQAALRLRRRRRRLDRLNHDVDAIHRRDALPHHGDPGEHGLVRRVVVRRREPRHGPWGRARVTPQGIAVTVGRGGTADERTLLVPADGTADEQAALVASALQFLLAEPAAFTRLAQLHAFARWLELPPAPVDDVVAAVLAEDARNPVALLLRAWARPPSDVGEMERAADECRVAWAASRSTIGRALAATKLALAQSQVRHRSVGDGPQALARARAAGVAADAQLAGVSRYANLARPIGRTGLASVNRLLDRARFRRVVVLAALARRLPGRRFPGLTEFAATVRNVRSLDRLLILQLKARQALAQSRFVTEDPDDLRHGIAVLRPAIVEFERHGLSVDPTTRNYLAYCLMASSGRFSRGARRGYHEAMRQLRLVLADFGVREGPAPAGADPAAPPTVAAMAEAFARGEGPPPASSPLRQRVLRLALANLGNIYRLTKQFDEALACYGAALWCDPDYLEAYGERAWLHLDRGRDAEADADMQEMLRRPAGTPAQKAKIVLDYVDALGRLRLSDEQDAWLDQAHRLDPENPTVAARRRARQERSGERGPA